MKKTVIMAVVMFLVVSSMIVLAQEEETADCNFWCKVSRFLFGAPENRAGKGWFERRAVVGEALGTFDATSGRLVVNGKTYIREPVPITIISTAPNPPTNRQYYVFIADDGEEFIFYDSAWRQVAQVPDNSETWKFQMESGDLTENHWNADISKVLTSENTQSLLPSQPPAPAPASIPIPGNFPDGTIYLSDDGNYYIDHEESDIISRIGNDGSIVTAARTNLVGTSQVGKYTSEHGWQGLGDQNMPIYGVADSDVSPSPTPAAPAPAASGATYSYTIDRLSDDIIVTTPNGGTLRYERTTATSNGQPVYRYQEGDKLEYYLASGERVNADGSKYGDGSVRSTVLGQRLNIPSQRTLHDVNRELSEGRLTHGEAYDEITNLANERRANLEFRRSGMLLANLPGSTQIKYNNVQYSWNADANQWKSADGASSIPSAELAPALINGKATSNNNELKRRVSLAQSDGKELKTLDDTADSYRWRGTMFDGIDQLGWYQDLRRYGSAVGDIATALSQLGSYRALSNALMPDATASWMEVANSEVLQRWADLPNFAAREACGFDDQKRVNTHGSSSVFVRTPSGTVQFVGSIQAERSERKSAVLCELNPDPEAEEEWICNRNEVCVDEQLCYKDANNDGDPDNPDQPEEGFFYKITWGVTAPRDERQTPYVDEDGKAIKFNVVLKGDGEAWLYTREGASLVSAIALSNGESDRDVILHYSPRQFTEACISFDSAHRFTDAGGDAVGDICTSFIISQRGVVEFSGSARSQSSTTASGQVERNRNW